MVRFPRDFPQRFFLSLAMFMAVCCAPAARGGEEQVLLETREAKITSQDFEAEIARIPEQDRPEVLASRERIRKLLENLLITKTMAARARSAGLDHDPAIVKQMEQAADKVLAKEQINRAIKGIEFPDFDARANELYRLNIEKYTSPERVHASHILVEIKGRTPEEALKRIQEARALAVGSKDFGDLALEYSDDPSVKQNRGDLGLFAAASMVKPFSDVAFAMSKPGEISEPVQTKFGYHIIQFHEKQPKKTASFDEVKAEIVKELRDKYIAEYRQNMFGAIVSDPSAKFNEAAVEKYHTALVVPPKQPTQGQEK
ncbi:MAG: peptidylprolyl isomerase [Gallionellaceae bacterium]